MSLQGINHLAFITDDMVKTIRFYRDLLGLKLSTGIGHDGFRHYFFQFPDGVTHVASNLERYPVENKGTNRIDTWPNLQQRLTQFLS